ncbi:MAG: hypothetical protein GXO92_05350 [FCB group bacterium]|nr:hypothetical protein [FCB group bacterium]
MGKRILLLLLFFTGFIQAQEEIFEQSYRKALEDSVITDEEQQMLEVLRQSLKLEENDVLAIEKRVASTPGLKSTGSQEGRWIVAWRNMSLGNGLYGWAIPYVLGAEDGTIYLASQSLAFGAGFYITWKYTKTMDIPRSRALFQAAGATLGVGSIWPLMSLVGYENWFRFDDRFKLGLTYMMAAAPVGTWLGDRLYKKWRPSDGQAYLIVQALTFGFLNGWAVHTILTPEENTANSENWWRLDALITSGSALASGYFVNKHVQGRSYTRGDATMIGYGSVYGAFVGMKMIMFLDIRSYKPALLAMMTAINGSTILTDRIIRKTDLTTGEANLVALGSLAGAAFARGISTLMGINETKIMDVVDIGSSFTGAYLSFKYLQSGNPLSARKNKSPWGVRITPYLIPGKTTVRPAMNIEVRF